MRRRAFVLVLGGAITAVREARARQKVMSVIGFLSASSPVPFAPYVAAFRQGLGEAGYVEGRNVTTEYRWADNHYDRMPALADDLVDRKVDVIVAGGGSNGIAAAKGASSTIPIVVFGGGDLVAAGIVASLARPGGNLTGISIFDRELNPKRLQLLSELVPQVEVIALLVNPTGYSGSESAMRDMEEAARTNGRPLAVLKASTEREIDAALATLTPLHAGVLVVASDPFFNSQREQLVGLAARHTVPAIYEWREFAAIGGLISYGPSLTGTWRQVGTYVGRVLAGANPADLPIQRPTRFELVINLTTAKALGLTIPPSIIARADEVVE